MRLRVSLTAALVMLVLACGVNRSDTGTVQLGSDRTDVGAVKVSSTSGCTVRASGFWIDDLVFATPAADVHPLRAAFVGLWLGTGARDYLRPTLLVRSVPSPAETVRDVHGQFQAHDGTRNIGLGGLLGEFIGDSTLVGEGSNGRRYTFVMRDDQQTIDVTAAVDSGVHTFVVHRCVITQ
jgi:hypothetical protein